MKGERQPQSYLEAAQEIHSHIHHTREKEKPLSQQKILKKHIFYVKKGLSDSLSMCLCVCVCQWYVDL